MMQSSTPTSSCNLSGVKALAWQYLQDCARQLFASYGIDPVYLLSNCQKHAWQTLVQDTASAAADSKPLKIWYAGPVADPASGPEDSKPGAFELGMCCLGAQSPQADAGYICMLMQLIEELGIDRSRTVLALNRQVHSGGGTSSTAVEARYSSTQELLDAGNIPYEEDPQLKAGAAGDGGIIFELRFQQEGITQSVLARGGAVAVSEAGFAASDAPREQPASPQPARGFAFSCYFEPLYQAIMASDNLSIAPLVPDVFVAAESTDPACAAIAFAIAQELRRANMIVETDLQNLAPAHQLELAEKLDAAALVLVQADSASTGMVQVHDMELRTKTPVKREEVLDYLFSCMGAPSEHDHEHGHSHG